MPTDIEWTRGDDGTKGETWNPTVGCSRVSPGCDNCYAIRVAARELQPAHVGLTTRGGRPRHKPQGDYEAPFVKAPAITPDWTGEVRLLHDRLEAPLHWRKPRRVFVDSMSDLFHSDVPVEFIQRVWNTMAQVEQHTFQVLTKRPQRMAAVLARHDMPGYLHDHTPPKNVWVGVSVENQRYADLRIPYLLETTAAVRFLSIEPLLGHVYLHKPDLACIDWVIVGGESGPGARPMHIDWARDLRDQCISAGVPFFFKQWGEWAPAPARSATHVVEMIGDHHPRFGEDLDGIAGRAAELVQRVGKKIAGRTLDGREWNEYP